MIYRLNTRKGTSFGALVNGLELGSPGLVGKDSCRGLRCTALSREQIFRNTPKGSGMSSAFTFILHFTCRFLLAYLEISYREVYEYGKEKRFNRA